MFDALAAQSVRLEALILKPNMVLSGLHCPHQASLHQVAEATLQCLRRSVPAAVAGIAFLSGGQPGALATARLNAINAKADGQRRPWPLVFSFARALQQPALSIWAGQDANVAAAQHALHYRACCNHAALNGAYAASMEEDWAYQKAS